MLNPKNVLSQKYPQPQKEPCEILQKKIPKKKFPKKISKKNWRKATKIFTLLNRGGEGAYTDATVITHLYTCTGKE